jgi:hypothetical protein
VCVCLSLCLSVSLKGSTESKRPRFWEALKAFALHTSVPDQEQQQKPRKHHRHPNNLVKITTNTKTSHASKGYVCRIVILNLLLRFSAAKSSLSAFPELEGYGTPIRSLFTATRNFVPKQPSISPSSYETTTTPHPLSLPPSLLS